MGILEGIRVLDLAAGLAGPVATLLLAELGAEVIKMEPPGGDSDRGTARFAVWNRSKSSIVLDLDQAADSARLDALLAEADIVLHDMPPSRARDRGLDDAALATRHPKLIAVTVAGFPAGHALEELPPDDMLVLAEAGLLDEQAGVRREGPTYLRFPLGSWAAAYLAAIGALARLIQRDRGHGTGPVATSLLQGALTSMIMLWYRAERPTESLSQGLPKHFEPSLFGCADGRWVHVLANADHVPLMQAGLAQLPPEARVPCAPTTTIRRIFPLMDANRMIYRTHPAQDWLDALWAADVPVQPALPMGALYEDAQAIANDYVVQVQDKLFGACRQPGVPFSVMPPATVRNPAPDLGDAIFWHDRPQRSPRSAPPPSAGAALPLAGVRILDFGNFLAGPFAMMLASDLGADVIKVEAVAGDQMRWIEWCFCACQRGKRSLALQLKDPRARDVLHRLIASADIVHHNLRMPAARKLGLSYEDMRAINPAIIYCHVSSYGPLGPRKDWPGYDQLFQAASGWEIEGGGQDNPPMYHRFGMMDHQCAMASLVAVLAALYHRDVTGQGQCVSASLLAASLFSASETVMLADGTLTPFTRLDTAQTGISPRHRLYQCQDGWMALAADRPEAWPALTQAAEGATVDRLEALFATHTVAEALALAARCRAHATRARTNAMQDFLDDPVNRSLGLLTRWQHAQYGLMDQIGAFWTLPGAPQDLTRPPPLLGEHSREILAEYGYAAAEIEALVMAGVAKAG